MSTQDTAGTSGRRRAARSAAVVAAAASGLLTLAGSATGVSLAGLTGAGAPGQAVALGGSTATCGGIRLNPAALPGRPVARTDHTGPAAAIAQVLRLYEWTRTTPYDGAAWSLVTATPDSALLVATLPTRTRYIPVHRRPDGDWQIDAPCQLVTGR